MKAKGDSGAYLRMTMGAMVLFGAPPEPYWPYTDAEDGFDKEPPAFCYAFAQNYKTLLYYRHDPAGVTRAAVLERLKTYLAAGHPAMFGFTVYSSIDQAETTGRIPVPFGRERIEGGHAVVAMGFDDAMTIANASGGEPARGALLIRNSWGKGWGEKGYGWLPYAYVQQGPGRGLLVRAEEGMDRHRRVQNLSRFGYNALLKSLSSFRGGSDEVEPIPCALALVLFAAADRPAPWPRRPKAPSPSSPLSTRSSIPSGTRPIPRKTSPC